ncbi:SRPBCC family protein [Sphingomonas sp. PR090111-T3T-6A]|uniref:SRPBCC family protein n=1 Tax=Sphingomonas sp. PR090111-T3T-6A TaxID=685778 RepID=UPI00037B37BE|nr:SRPBCC family protein [Sphingomonas sp. PR090111-T3T-6A]
MNEPDFVYVIYIRASAQAVWDALTDGHSTASFWYGRTNESTWKKGDIVTFRAPSGEIDFTGEITESDPPHRLSHGFLHGAPGPMRDEGSSRVTYDITPVEDGTVRLTLMHSGFPEGSVIRPGIARGWPVILSGLKTLLETGRPLADMLDLEHVAGRD